jgi:hypothetical protein
MPEIENVAKNVITFTFTRPPTIDGVRVENCESGSRAPTDSEENQGVCQPFLFSPLLSDVT